jgi:anti-anti-sigma factor
MRLADIQTELVGRILVVRLSGEIDMSNAGELGSVVLQHVTNETLGLVLEMSDVAYVDSAGINTLFELRGQLRNRGQQLRLVVPPGAAIAGVLEIVDAPRAIGVCENTDAAIQSIDAATPPPS